MTIEIICRHPQPTSPSLWRAKIADVSETFLDIPISTEDIACLCADTIKEVPNPTDTQKQILSSWMGEKKQSVASGQ